MNFPDQRKFFITYGDGKFKQSLARITKEAKNFGEFANVTAFSPNTLSKEFREKHMRFINKSRKGGGFYIWKTDIVKQTLAKMNNNDILVYLDSGCKLNSQGKERFNEYVKMINKDESGILRFQMHQHLEKWWTKSDLLDHFGVLTDKSITDTGQIIGGIFMIRKCPKALAIVDEWCKTCTNYHFIDNSPSKIRNDKLFQQHRHDQSIISVICKIRGCVVLKDETYFKNSWNTIGLKFPFWAMRIRK